MKESSKKSGWLTLLFPSKCLHCQKQGADLCDTCSLLWQPSLRTRHVGELRVYNAHPYSDVAQSIILAAKEDHSASARFLLAESIWFLIKKNLAYREHPAITLLPIPSRPSANRKRGFWHTEELCREIQRINRKENYFDSITVENLLFLRKNIRDQSQLNLPMRQKNLDRSMSVKSISRITRITKGVIIMIDDLVTSGSTIQEAERALRSAGLRPVAAYVACSSR